MPKKILVHWHSTCSLSVLNVGSKSNSGQMNKSKNIGIRPTAYLYWKQAGYCVATNSRIGIQNAA